MDTSREQLVTDAISFMQSIVGHYGQEKGLEMWEAIADTCDPGLKSDIFIKMLTGDFGGRITVTGVITNANAVSCIKAIRSVDLRQPGLKEAKDLFDACKYNNKSFIVEVNAGKRGSASRELRSAGFIV